MNKFKIYYKLFIVFSVLIISGCDSIFQSNPEDVLSKYLEAALIGDHKKAYSYISSKDKKNKSLQQYISEKNKHSQSELVKLFIDKTTHKILNIELNGNIANIEVGTTTIDLKIITNEFVNASLKAVNSGKSFQDIQKDIAEKYNKNQDLPLNTYKSNHKLIKENNEWKVVLNL